MQYKNIQNITLKINEQQNILSNTSNDIKTLQNDIDTKANKEHTHEISDINQLNNTLENKANTEHTHEISDINQLNNTLENKANTEHTHEINDINQLNNALENKANAEHTHTTTDITDINSLKAELLKTIYPVGSIYTSMTNTSPATLFGFGTWTQITDRFLYCSTSSNTTGGSKTITEENLPAHTHTFNGDNMYGEAEFRPNRHEDTLKVLKSGVFQNKPNQGETWKNTLETYSNEKKCDILIFNATPTGTIGNTGSGTDYMPPYITVYCWYRVE